MAQRRLVEIVLQGKDKTKGAFDSLGLNLTSGQAKALKFAGAAAAVGAALATATKQLYDFTAQMAQTGDRADKLSARLDITVEALSELEFVAKRGGVPVNTLTMALQRMVRRVAEAAKGTGEAKDAIKELGFEAGRLTQMTPEDQFYEIARALQSVEGQSDKVRLAFKLFDSEGVGVLQTMRGDLAEVRKEFERFGGPMASSFSDASASFADAQTNLATATDRLKEAFAEPLLEPFAAVINKFADAVIDLRDTLPRVAPEAGPGGRSGEFTAGGAELTQEGLAGLPGFTPRSFGPTTRAPRGPRNYDAPAAWDMSGMVGDPRYITRLQNEAMGLIDPGSGDLMSGWDSSIVGAMDPGDVVQDWFVGLDDLSAEMEQMGLVFQDAENAAGNFGNQFGAAIGTGLARALTSAENFGDAFVMILQSFFEQALASVGSSIFGSILGSVGGAILPGSGGAFSEIGGAAKVASAGTKGMPTPIVMSGIGAGYSAAQAANAKVYV